MRALVAALALVAAMLPRGVGAQAPGVLDFTAEQARAAFVRAGYEVDPSAEWSWLSPPITTFRVHDSSRDRVLLVEVYPDAQQAQIGLRRSHALEAYSATTWIHNLTISEATEGEYAQRSAAALIRSVGMQIAAEADDRSAASRARASVDLEYVAAVFDGPTIAY
jgi:hypothetical protein